VDFQAWYTLGVVGLLIAALVSNRVGPDTAMIGALTLLMVAGIIDPRSALIGFAHPAVLMVAALFVVATGLGETGAMTMVAQRLLGRPRTLAGAQARMMAPVAAMSAVMNNTPIVAMYLPIINDWARKLKISPSKLFMPLSYAAILGGTCTLIGTSSNIAINNLYVEYATNNRQALGDAFGLDVPSPTKQFWWISVVGIPSAVAGIGYILLASRWLLPERKPPFEQAIGERQYTVEMLVEPKGPIVGRSIEDAGLRQLPGLYLSEIDRGGNVLPAVGPDQVLEAGDRLVFVGVVESVVDLLKIRGLTPATDQVSKVESDRRERTVVEAVVSHNSPLIRRSVRQNQFRTRYNAAIIAVHRNGQRVAGKIGDIVLQPGDTLLLSTHAGFIPAYRNSPHFYLVSSVPNAREIRHERAGLALAIMGLLVLLLTVPLAKVIALVNATLGTTLPEVAVQPIVAAFLGATLMVFTRCCTGTTARNSINWQVLIVIGSALGIGQAMQQTGVAEHIARAMLDLVGGLGPTGMLMVLFLLTSLFAQVITNNGSAVLMFPIAMATARDLGVSPEPLVVSLMVAAGCSFMTPIAYQTNLMVFGPGGYRFGDYLRLGVPLTLLVAVICTFLAPLAFPFHP